MSGVRKEWELRSNTLLIVIPTINEQENLVYLLPMIFSSQPRATVLIVDDGSTDGTREFASSLKSPTCDIRVKQRHGRKGIGAAHVDGLKFAISENFNLCITMDADLTHDPKYLSEILLALTESENHSVIIASRFLQVGGTSNWTFIRKTMTKLGHGLTRTLLGMKWDVSSGYRGYRVDRIDPLMLSWLEDTSYEFFPKSAYFFKMKKLQVNEIFVHLPQRTYGNSKMTFSKVIVLLSNILKLRVDYALAVKRGVI